MKKIILLLSGLFLLSGLTPALANNDAALVISQLRALKGQSNVLVLYQDTAFFRLNDQIVKRGEDMADKNVVVIPTNDYDVAKQLGAKNNFPRLFLLDKQGELIHSGGVDTGLDTILKKIKD